MRRKKHSSEKYPSTNATRNKKCAKCDQLVPMTASFCQYCGSTKWDYVEGDPLEPSRVFPSIFKPISAVKFYGDKKAEEYKNRKEAIYGSGLRERRRGAANQKREIEELEEQNDQHYSPERYQEIARREQGLDNFTRSTNRHEKGAKYTAAGMTAAGIAKESGVPQAAGRAAFAASGGKHARQSMSNFKSAAKGMLNPNVPIDMGNDIISTMLFLIMLSLFVVVTTFLIELPDMVPTNDLPLIGNIGRQIAEVLVLIMMVILTPTFMVLIAITGMMTLTRVMTAAGQQGDFTNLISRTIGMAIVLIVMVGTFMEIVIRYVLYWNLPAVLLMTDLTKIFSVLIMSVGWIVFMTFLPELQFVKAMQTNGYFELVMFLIICFIAPVVGVLVYPTVIGASLELIAPADQEQIEIPNSFGWTNRQFPNKHFDNRICVRNVKFASQTVNEWIDISGEAYLPGLKLNKFSADPISKDEIEGGLTDVFMQVKIMNKDVSYYHFDNLDLKEQSTIEGSWGYLKFEGRIEIPAGKGNEWLIQFYVFAKFEGSDSDEYKDAQRNAKNDALVLYRSKLEDFEFKTYSKEKWDQLVIDAARLIRGKALDGLFSDLAKIISLAVLLYMIFVGLFQSVIYGSRSVKLFQNVVIYSNELGTGNPSFNQALMKFVLVLLSFVMYAIIPILAFLEFDVLMQILEDQLGS